jgi:ABC-type amino acid transport system permease subunit
MRLSRRRCAGAGRRASSIEVFRTTPPLVQLFWFFFALPILIQVEMTPFVAVGADLLASSRRHSLPRSFAAASCRWNAASVKRRAHWA